MRTKTMMVGTVKAIDTDDPNGAFEVILSTPTLDRDDEIIDGHAFDPLPDHITFDIDHGLSVATTVGSGVPRYEGDDLVVTGTFASIPRAQEVRTLVKEGHIRTTSVAFMAPKVEIKDGKRHIVKAELLNGAFVPVPANRDAVVLAGKSLAGDGPERTRKAIPGSYEERRQEIGEAIAQVVPDGWTWVVATFDDTVIYEVESRTDGVTRWQASYSIADDGTVELGDAIEVEIVEVVQPKAADTAADDTDTKTASDPEGAADEAATPPAPGAKAIADRAALALLEAEAAALLV